MENNSASVATQLLDQYRADWTRFYRMLRREDQKHLDQLFDGARYFTAACDYEANPVPVEGIFFAMLMHLQKQIYELQEKSGRIADSS